MFRLLSPELIELINDEVLNPGELVGRARDKSLEGALSRVDNRLAYGLIGDAFALAACYAEAIAQEAEGQLAVDQAEALRNQLRNEILNSTGGSIFLALEAAENLNMRKVMLNSNDPRVPLVLDLWPVGAKGDFGGLLWFRRLR